MPTMPGINRLHYGWVVVGVTCLVLLTGAGARSTPGILMVPLEQEFHWSRATIALAVSINLILYGCIGPFAAAIMDRFGIRRSILCALAVLAVGVSSTSLMREAWQLILMWGFLVGGATGFLATVLAATVATRWFTARRGLVIGMLSGGAATGQLLFLPVMAGIAENFGWRATVLTIAAVALCVMPFVALLMRDRPSDIGLMPYGETGEPKPVPRPQGNPVQLAFRTLAEAVRVRDYWLLAGTFFICGASTNGLIGTHLIPACMDSVYYTVRGVSLLFLPFSFDTFYGLSIFAVFYGLDWFATVSPTVRLIGNAFGREKAGIVYGWVFATHQLGGASAAFFGGLLRVNFGGYMEAFMVSGALCFLAAIMVLFITGGRKAPEPAAPAVAKAA
jgi:sugar phosphate permease